MIRVNMKTAKMRCRNCEWLNYDFIFNEYEKCEPGKNFCGLHGRARVDIDGPQLNLDSFGSCGFLAKKKTVPVQLQLDLF